MSIQTPKRETLNKFLDLAISNAAANGEDQRLGFRIDRIETSEETRTVRFDLSCGAICIIDLEYLVPRNSIDAPDASEGATDARA